MQQTRLQCESILKLSEKDAETNARDCLVPHRMSRWDEEEVDVAGYWWLKSQNAVK